MMCRSLFALPTLIRVGLLTVGVAACASSQGLAAAEDQSAEVARPLPMGPRKRIAVARFDAAGSFLSAYGGWDVGGGLAAQLTTALVNSRHFIVVERAELASVLQEQEMALQKIVSNETAAQVSRVLGAQLLVRGSVTEFEQKARGRGLRLGVGRGNFGSGLGVETVHGVVGMDIRLIDTTTGQVLQSHRVEETAQQSGVSADIDVRQVSLGGDAFHKTVLGQATRRAIEQAVDFIIRAMEPVPWTGRVVDVQGDEVYINAGATEGLKPGDLFSVTTVVRELTDPESGALLGVIEQEVGEVEVAVVEEKFSVARTRVPFRAKRGDLVKLARR